jgi:1,4-alpha-glucan branching enzyme
MLSLADVELVVNAHHANPFAILGMHTNGEGLCVRAFLPGAERVVVVDDLGVDRGELARIHGDGLFEGRVTGTTYYAYRLRVHYPFGHTVTVDDPYRFGPVIGAQDEYYLGEGSHLRPWNSLGSHPCEHEGVRGVRFAVWAPNARRVAVVGDFNHWDRRCHPMRLRFPAGVWELFIPSLAVGARYKYDIVGRDGRVLPLKADPYAFAAEFRPADASVIASTPPARGLPPARRTANERHAPLAIYEVHLGSWRRNADGGFLDWEQLAAQLPAYAADLGFTHIELLPIAEHPFDGSWGYQVTGMYAPTARFGNPEGFGRFVDACHALGIGVLLDWVPAHFPTDPYALGQFDGSALYEYADPREGFHRDWNTLIYNFGRTEVRNFLVGNALYWIECWGIDGLRVDAVASMLYRDYSRGAGEWVPNVQGGRENLEAIAFVRRMNEVIGQYAPAAVTIAEESTAWPAVSRPTSTGGLGFHYKWNMGWMHDTLKYMSKEPVHRKFHHNELTFSLIYAFDENFVLPLSHDEVVHGKGSLLNKMPGDRWQKFANLRAYYGFMWAHPGKKLLFMGGEFAQEREWNHDQSLDWHLPEHGSEHRGVQILIRDLNHLYTSRTALHTLDCECEGFEWIDANDADNSMLAFLRKGADGSLVLAVCNFTPVPRHDLRLGVPDARAWKELLNTDSSHYGGSNVGNGDRVLEARPLGAHGRPHSIAITLPPLATVVFAPV